MAGENPQNNPATSSPATAPNTTAHAPTGDFDYGFFGDEPEVVVVPADPAPASAEPTPAPAPEVHKHSRSLERAAIEVGLSDEEISSTPSDALYQRVYQMQKAQLAEARQAARAETVIQKPTAEVQPPPADPDQEYEFSEADGWDAKFVKQWKSMRDELKATKAELAELRQVKQHVQTQQVQTVEGEFESFFAKHEQIYGKGHGRTLDPNGPEMARRRAIVQAVVAMGGNVTTVSNDAGRVHSTLFGTLTPAATPASPSPPPPVSPERQAMADAWRNGGVARPTQRDTPALPKGREAAIKAIENLRREQVLNGTAVIHDDDPMDGLPG